METYLGDPSDVERVVIKKVLVSEAHEHAVPRFVFSALRLRGNQTMVFQKVPLKVSINHCEKVKAHQ